MATRQYRSTVEAKTLSAPINNSIGSMSVGPDGETLPNTFPYTLVIDPDLAAEEIVTVTASGGGGTLLTITRGQDGTSAQPHDPGAIVRHMITPRDMQEPQNHIEATQSYTIKNDGADPGVSTPTISKSVHGIGSGEGTVVGTDKVQVLKNKTLSGAGAGANTFTSIPQASVTDLVTDLASKTTALTAHEADTTAIHGIADTSKLATFASTSVGRKLSVQDTAPSTPAIGDIWFQVTGL